MPGETKLLTSRQPGKEKETDRERERERERRRAKLPMPHSTVLPHAQ
jgi:hypothetical protein